MKRVITLLLAGAFSMAIVGCHAEADVNHPDDTRSGDATYKKTTKINTDTGARETKIETHTNP